MQCPQIGFWKFLVRNEKKPELSQVPQTYGWKWNAEYAQELKLSSMSLAYPGWTKSMKMIKGMSILGP
jgi:hypothetical protein